ncbi:MAG: FtsL-like putative cell division protein [Janthinobacterium lividum]
MAGNTIRPVASGPPRANTPRPPRQPEPVNEPAAAGPAMPPLPPAPVAVAPVVPEPAPTPPARKTRPAVTDTEPVDWPAPPRRGAPDSPGSSWSLFSLLDRFTGLDGLFREGLPVRYLPKLLFVMLLTLIYIGNTHYGNRMNRSIQKLKQETEDLRADYTTLKSDYMEASKQSEVARKVAAIGLVESQAPPFRIAVPAGHLDAAELEAMPVLTADTLAARAIRDSVAAHRADSLQGRARRQQLGLPTDDDALELGAPPPGLTAEDSAAATSNSLRNRYSADKKRDKSARSKKKIGTKKSKTGQRVPGHDSHQQHQTSAHRASSH